MTNKSCEKTSMPMKINIKLFRKRGNIYGHYIVLVNNANGSKATIVFQDQLDFVNRCYIENIFVCIKERERFTITHIMQENKIKFQYT
jgi:hypothetical protein